MDTPPEVPKGETKVRTKPDSPFAVEVLVKGPTDAAAKAKAPRKDEKGRIFIDLAENDIYHLNLYNETKGNEKFDAAVTITVDGLDVFRFSDDKKSDGKPKFSHFVIAPNEKPSTIFGWHKTNSPESKANMLSFLVTEYGKGAASEAIKAPRGTTGVITVAMPGQMTHQIP